jgi:hypothetical protein
MKKICSKCNEEKELSEFHKKKNMKDGHRNECKECVKGIQKKYKEDPKFIKKEKSMIKIDMKTKKMRYSKEKKNIILRIEMCY